MCSRRQQSATPIARPRRIPLIGTAAAALLLVGLFAAPAEAHRLNIWAAVESGRTIKGKVYFAGGSSARAVRVSVLDANGQLLTELRTDDNGEFIFQAETRADHQFVADSGDGHRRTFTVEAAELRGEPRESTTIATSDEPPAEAEPSDDAEIERLVDEAVGRHVIPLREQLRAHEDKTRLHDILGGIGCILGVTGVAFYFMGRRRNR